MCVFSLMFALTNNFYDNVLNVLVPVFNERTCPRSLEYSLGIFYLGPRSLNTGTNTFSIKAVKKVTLVYLTVLVKRLTTKKQQQHNNTVLVQCSTTMTTRKTTEAALRIDTVLKTTTMTTTRQRRNNGTIKQT